jgi:ubiquinone/menaquinone biosynthesis C-methylase UbiE
MPKQLEYSIDDWNLEYTRGSYRNKWDSSMPTPDLVATISALGLSPGTFALDLGCGAGSESLYLAKKGFKVTAIDCSSAAIGIARSRALLSELDVHFYIASVLELPLADSTIDFAIDRGCLHSLPKGNWTRYSGELARVLRSGGYALLRGCSDPSIEAFSHLSSDTIHAYFDTNVFHHIAVEPIQLCTAHGHINATLALLQKR